MRSVKIKKNCISKHYLVSKCSFRTFMFSLMRFKGWCSQISQYRRIVAKTNINTSILASSFEWYTSCLFLKTHATKAMALANVSIITIRDADLFCLLWRIRMGYWVWMEYTLVTTEEPGLIGHAQFIKLCLTVKYLGQFCELSMFTYYYKGPYCSLNRVLQNFIFLLF